LKKTSTGAASADVPADTKATKSAATASGRWRRLARDGELESDDDRENSFDDMR
jgi:hypothetical protein